jgi:hypothetical protein
MALALVVAGHFLIKDKRVARRVSLLVVLLALVAPMTGRAVSNVFVNGTVADAEEVNENFSELEARIDALPFSVGGLNYMTIPAAAFRPADPGDDCVLFGSAAWCNDPAVLVAPMNLPDGVFMSEVTCYGRDSDPASDFSASGQVILIPSTNTTGFNSCSSSGSPGVTECTINVAPGLQRIDQQAAGYFITFSHPGGGDLIRLNACRIAFEL